MKKYVCVNVDCYSYTEMLEIYESKYKADYQLIGYSHDSFLSKGELVLYPK